MKKKSNRFSKTRLRRQTEQQDFLQARALEGGDSLKDPEKKKQDQSPGLSFSEEQALWGE